MSDFYNELSSNGIFFFWIVVFLFVLLTVLLVVLFFKNRKLNHLISNMVKEENKEDNIIVNNNSIIDTNEKKVETIIDENVVQETEVKPIIEEQIKVEKFKPVIEEKKIEAFKPVIEEKKVEPKIEKAVVEETGPYKKNVLREMSKKMPISPIGIVRNDDSIKEEKIDLGIREDMISPLEEMEDNYSVNDNMKFASEIVEQMEKEMKPSNIELTDYEKKQEEEAIISYDELLKVKDKIYNITEEEENDDFIDELKNFRLDLQ